MGVLVGDRVESLKQAGASTLRAFVAVRNVASEGSVELAVPSLSPVVVYASLARAVGSLRLRPWLGASSWAYEAPCGS